MWCSFIPARFGAVSFYLLILIICLGANGTAQTADPKLLSAPEFILSPEAVAAGIDGLFRVTLSIDEAGNVKGVRLYGDPMWPCGTAPKRELDAVRSALQVHLRLLKFSPSLKNGKPRESDVMLEFAISDAFRRSAGVDEVTKGSSPKLVKAGIVNGRAIHLVKPLGAPAKGTAEVQVLIDEQGSVSKAGLHTGNPLLSTTLREAACASKFSPTVIGGKPVRITGILIYILQ